MLMSPSRPPPLAATRSSSGPLWPGAEVKDLGAWPNPRKPPVIVKRRPQSSPSVAASRWGPLRELQVKRQKDFQRLQATKSGDQPDMQRKPNAHEFRSKSPLQGALAATNSSSTQLRRSVLQKTMSLPDLIPQQEKVKKQTKSSNKVYFFGEHERSNSLPLSATRDDVPSIVDVAPTETAPTLEDSPAKSSCGAWRNSGCGVMVGHDDGGDWRMDTSVSAQSCDYAQNSPASYPVGGTFSARHCTTGAYPRNLFVQSPNLSTASETSGFEEGRLSFRDAFSRHHRNDVVIVGQDLCDALASMGYAFAFHDMLEATNLKLTTGRMALDFEDFSLVASSYISQHSEVLRTAFNRKADAADSGKVAPGHLPGILAEVGIHMMLGFEEDLPSMSVDFETFMTFYHEVSRRAGLTLAEYRRILVRMEALLSSRKMMALEKALEAFCFSDMLLKLAGGKSVVVAIISQVGSRAAEGRLTLDINMNASTPPISDAPLATQIEGFDISCLPNFMDTTPQEYWSTHFNIHVFFVAARIIHEHIGRGLLAVTRLSGFDLARFPICQEDLVVILEECGFIQTVFQGVTSFIEDCGFKERLALQFGEVYTIVLRFCLANGLTQTERNDITIAFNALDKNRDGVLSVGELKGMIRLLGYRPTVHRVYNFAEELGMTEMSYYTCDEFVELMSKFFTMNMWSAWTRFYGLSRDCSRNTPRLPIQELAKLLKNLGHDVTQEEVDCLIEQAGGPSKEISFADFKKLELKHRHNVRAVMACSGGLTGWEVAKYIEHFQKHADNQGFVSHKQMRKLLIELFPSRTTDKEWNLRLVEKVKRIVPQSTAQFDLLMYMAFRQSLTGELDGDVLTEGLRLRQKLGYSREEIKEFRDLYAASDLDLSGSLDFTEVLQILSKLIEISSEDAKRELEAHFMEMDDGDHELTFFEFLQLVHRLHAQNWRNINLLAERRRSKRQGSAL